MTKNNQKTRKTIIDLSHSEARQFFIRHESYCNFDLPPYIRFDKILKKISSILKPSKLTDFYENNQEPKITDNINHIILHNKDGKYAWRPLQIIHPALYVSLVHEITEEDRWEEIRRRFKRFKKQDKIQCMSIPVVTPKNKKQKPEQILTWWEKAEQKSIGMSLDYEYLVHIDIANCYGSLYTHSIPWALHGRNKIKKTLEHKSSKDKNLIGNIIDKHLINISYGQTNGIPQGSILMDFIAEMVLGYIDILLIKKLESIGEFNIIRYRDDYRIFTNSMKEAENIVKHISEILIGFGMTLNPYKTKPSAQAVTDSIKPDKLYWIQKLYWAQKLRIQNFQAHLLIIHGFAMQFPNSGALIKALQKYDKKLDRREKKTKISNVYQLISIITDIAYHNPKTYAVSASILSKFIKHINKKSNQMKVIEKIKKKFKKIPNTGHLDIWLQRVTIGFEKDEDIDTDFDEPICKIVNDQDDVSIWKSSWLKPKLRNEVKSSLILDRKKLQKVKRQPIDPKEIEVFPDYY